METQQPSRGASLSLRSVPSLFWVIAAVSTCLAMILILILAVTGYRDGIRRGAAQRRQHVTILWQHASDMLNEGRRREALAAYRKIIEIDAQNEGARAAIATVEAMPVETATPTAQAATPTLIEIEWAKVLALQDAGRWEESIARMVQMRAAQSDFMGGALTDKLFSAYVILGREKAGEDSLEEAVQLFDKALELKPDDAQVRLERHMIAQYLNVKTYWGADWSRTIHLLEDLYRLDPAYRDAQFLLQRAHVEYGDSFARAEEWCAAAAEYTSAIAVLDWLDLRTRRAELIARCEASQTKPEEGSSGPAGSRTDGALTDRAMARDKQACAAQPVETDGLRGAAES